MLLRQPVGGEAGTDEPGHDLITRWQERHVARGTMERLGKHAADMPGTGRRREVGGQATGGGVVCRAFRGQVPHLLTGPRESLGGLLSGEPRTPRDGDRVQRVVDRLHGVVEGAPERRHRTGGDPRRHALRRERLSHGCQIVTPRGGQRRDDVLLEIGEFGHAGASHLVVIDDGLRLAGTRERAEEGVVVPLGDGVELVVMAAGARDRQPLKRLAERVDLALEHLRLLERHVRGG